MGFSVGSVPGPPRPAAGVAWAAVITFLAPLCSVQKLTARQTRRAGVGESEREGASRSQSQSGAPALSLCSSLRVTHWTRFLLQARAPHQGVDTGGRAGGSISEVPSRSNMPFYVINAEKKLSFDNRKAQCSVCPLLIAT